MRPDRVRGAQLLLRGGMCMRDGLAPTERQLRDWVVPMLSPGLRRHELRNVQRRAWRRVHQLRGPASVPVRRQMPRHLWHRILCGERHRSLPRVRCVMPHL